MYTSGVAVTKNIEIPAVDNETNNEIGGKDGKVGKDIGSDEDGARGELGLALDVGVDATIPRGHAEKSAARTEVVISSSLAGGVGRVDGKTRHCESGRSDCQDDEKFFKNCFHVGSIY